jgi:CheY-like chemotaxis protein
MKPLTQKSDEPLLITDAVRAEYRIETEYPPTLNSVACSPQEAPRVLVIDDDPLFRALITRAGQRRKIPVAACANLRELNAMAVPRLFDVAVVDYYLDDMKRYLKGTEVARALEGTPVILVSNSDDGIEDEEPWPAGVREFISKRSGIQMILNAAIKMKAASLHGRAV